MKKKFKIKILVRHDITIGAETKEAALIYAEDLFPDGEEYTVFEDRNLD